METQSPEKSFRRRASADNKKKKKEERKKSRRENREERIKRTEASGSEADRKRSRTRFEGTPSLSLSLSRSTEYALEYRDNIRPFEKACAIPDPGRNFSLPRIETQGCVRIRVPSERMAGSGHGWQTVPIVSSRCLFSSSRRVVGAMRSDRRIEPQFFKPIPSVRPGGEFARWRSLSLSFSVVFSRLNA